MHALFLLVILFLGSALFKRKVQVIIPAVGNGRNWSWDTSTIRMFVILTAVMSALVTSIFGCKPVSESSFQAARRAIEQNDIAKLKQVLNAEEIDQQVRATIFLNGAYTGYTLLHFAVEENSLGMVNYLLESGATPDLHGDFADLTPIMVAIQSTPRDEITFQIVSSLIKHGADVNVRTSD